MFSSSDNKFLSLAKLGKNNWWRYLVTLLLIFVTWQIIGGIPFAIFAYTAAITQGYSAQELNSVNTLFQAAFKENPILSYILLNLPFVIGLITLYICIKFIHKRSFLSLITPTKLSITRILQGAGLYLVTTIIPGLLVVSKDQYQLNPGFKLSTWIPFAFLAIILTGCQILFEEVLFRGYLMQWIGLKTARVVVPFLVSTLIFGALHLFNPENSWGIWASLSYFVLGGFWGIITIIDERLELAIGCHAMNNLFATLFIGYTNSVLPNTGIYIANITTITVVDFLVLILGSILFCTIIFVLPKYLKKDSKLQS